MTGPLADVEAVAAEAFRVLGTGRQTPPFSERHPGLTLAQAYRVAARVRETREARGERPVGRKIGFTNRTIWAEYGVDRPMWGYLYDRTVSDFETGPGATLSLQGLAEPRIEPEIVFGLAGSPRAGMREGDLLGCIAWIAHGFEIVQSIFPGWRFAVADTVAAYGLHGALLVGPRHPIAARADAWLAELSSFTVALSRNGGVVDRGQGTNVLGGPLSALRHLVDLLATEPADPPLAAGEIVTTGTLTRAFPMLPDEAWTTTFEGIGLEGARLRLVA